MRRRYSERDRSKFLAEMHRSGDAVWAVAKRVAVSKATAYRWWTEEQKTGAAPVIEFAPLVRSAPLACQSVVVELGAARIRVEPGFDAELLRSVVAALSTEDES
ncbi:MAG: hypothetical protein H6716_29355 [Polyangiaceae bacterium]|nr:hypothetical protein [Polyangiaceae bacterium]